MSWRAHNTHKEETKAVKDALKETGINAMVGHGKGTAWTWLEVNIGKNPSNLEHKKNENGFCFGNCLACEKSREIRMKVLKIAQKVTGRDGEYDGNILILTQDHWDKKKGCSVPIVQDNLEKEVKKDEKQK